MYKLPAIILSGGKSSRMGRDKSALPFGDYASLGEYQYLRLKQYFERVYLSAKYDKFDFDAPIILDRYEVHSPLSALISIFETLPDDAVFVLSVDVPFAGEEIVAELMEHLEDKNDIIAAQSPDGIEPLCAIYKRSILPKAKEMLQNDNHRLKALLETLDTQTVLFKEDHPFLNLNHPDEYEEALRRI